ncbi:MAG: ATP-binding protein [Dehalococcoidia bacterium]
MKQIIDVRSSRAPLAIKPSIATDKFGTEDDSIQESEDGYRRLYELMLRLSATESLEAALEEVLTAAMDLVHAEAGHVRLFDRETGEYAFLAHKGFRSDLVQSFGAQAREFFARSPAVEAIEKAQRVIVEDIESYPPMQPYPEIVREVGYASLQATPLFNYAGKPIGSITTFFQRHHVPSKAQLQTLDLYARLAADTIEREGQREEQARTEQALRKAIAVKDEFLGLVSHELRTPMTVIRGLSSVLSRNPDLPRSTLLETFKDLNIESERLYRLIENMLALARVQAGQKQPTELALLDKLMQASAEKLRSDLPDLVLELTPLPRDVIVQLVPSYLDQILHNLVENAYKYSARGSTVEVCTDAFDDRVEIHVADRGVGVTDVESLFQPFQREEHAETLASGMGLGLAVCRTLVEAHGGRIWAAPRGGGGTVFTFSLPRQESGQGV